MPASSQSQQKLMAQAYQVKKFMLSGGKEGTDPKDIDTEYRQQIEDLANSMTKKSLQDFAETKIKDLPKKKIKEGMSGFLSAGPFPQFYSFVMNIEPSRAFYNKDNKDPLIKKFMDFINGEKDDANEGVSAVVPVGTPQTLNNTPGMGNVTLPSIGGVGSGDTFNANNDKIGILKYDDYKKWLENWKNKKKKKK